VLNDLVYQALGFLPTTLIGQRPLSQGCRSGRLACDHPLLPRCDRWSVVFNDQLDRSHDAGVQGIEILGGDPVLQDGLGACLVPDSSPGRTAGR
jgi:hypothetical protein